MIKACGRVSASSTSIILAKFRAELAEFSLLRSSRSLTCSSTNGSISVTPNVGSCRAYASGAVADESNELEDGLIWPPTPEALAANPVLAHALRRAAKHARSELQLRVNQALRRPTRQVISRNDLQRLQEQHIAKELLQCDMHVSNSQAQNLQTLWQVLEQHQPSVPPQQQPSVEHSRIAVKPAASDRAQTSDIQAEGRTVYAKIANPLEIANMLVAAKADDVCILDVASQCSFTEHMVLATGRSHRHIQAAAAAVAYQMTLRCSEVAPGIRPSVEGEDGSDWCVVDAGGRSVDELQTILKQQLKDYTATGDDDRILPKQILQIADFFTMGLFAHSKLYHFLFTQPQAHDEQNIILQVETAVVQPLKDALTEEQWVQHNASLAAEAEAQKQAQEAAELERQLAEAEATQQQAAEAAEALRQSALTKVEPGPNWLPYSARVDRRPGALARD
ncbi:hypothetical protein ABBQ38_003177 [Trebouxia sp. C0009 RCD-2024]